MTSIDPVMTPYEPIESVCVYPELINHFKKSNNDKSELKLMNHAQVLGQLGESWISKYVPDQLNIIDLLDLKTILRASKKAKTTSCLPDHPKT